MLAYLREKIKVAKFWLKQPSTKKGIVAIGAVCWLVYNPAQFNEIVMGLVALYGLYQTVRDESQNEEGA